VALISRRISEREAEDICGCADEHLLLFSDILVDIRSYSAARVLSLFPPSKTFCIAMKFCICLLNHVHLFHYKIENQNNSFVVKGLQVIEKNPWD